MKHTCFFCGNEDMQVHKFVHSDYVQDILDKQHTATIDDTILTYSQNLLNTTTAAFTSDDRETWICTCMCCFHWVERRKALPVPPLPMQNLLWFMMCLEWYDENKCDKRILQRLVTQVAKSYNIYHACFLPEEITGLRAILATISTKQDTQLVCIKSELARFYQRENGNGLLLAHKQLADLLRPDYA
tara:strand:- start:2171 stop:2731 length:561 start_codon:yes stop_codon:yes gene_type:complete